MNSQDKIRQRLMARQAEQTLNRVIDDLGTITYISMYNDKLSGKTNHVILRKLSQTLDLLNELYVELPISFDPEYRKGEEK